MTSAACGGENISRIMMIALEYPVVGQLVAGSPPAVCCCASGRVGTERSRSEGVRSPGPCSCSDSEMCPGQR